MQVNFYEKYEFYEKNKQTKKKRFILRKCKIMNELSPYYWLVSFWRKDFIYDIKYRDVINHRNSQI